MAEFKFSCPNCNQHIQCDTGYAGMQIHCPTCKQVILVPQAPPTVAAPSAVSAPPPPPIASPPLATRQSTMTSAAGRRFPRAPGAQTPKPQPRLRRNTLIVSAVAVVCAGLGFGGVTFFLMHQAKDRAAKGNPAAQVATPTSAATVQALSILSKVHSAYTNMTSVNENHTVTLFLDLSDLTMADVNPNLPANAKNADRRPPGMPRIVTNTTELTIKRAPSNRYYLAGEAVTKADRQTTTNTFAFWRYDKGQFMFMDMHQRRIAPIYRQLPEVNPAGGPQEQFRSLQRYLDDPAQLTKIIKNLGQTDDESLNGQDCYTLTAKVLGQKVKIWVDKATFLIPQWQITLGGAISDADLDDAFSLFAAVVTNMPPAQLEIIKAQVKQATPAVAKIRGVITSTCTSIQVNPTLAADDFDYPVPAGVRLIPLNARPAANAAAQNR